MRACCMAVMRYESALHGTVFNMSPVLLVDNDRHFWNISKSARYNEFGRNCILVVRGSQLAKDVDTFLESQRLK